MSAPLAEAAGARGLLLATASAIMREGDIVDISLSELSCRSGLNSALVKYYFGNKAGLMKALLDRDMAAIVASVDALLAKDMAPEAKLRRHLAAMIDTFYACPYLYRLLMRLIRESEPGEARRIAEAYLNPIHRAYERLIGEGVELGVFRATDPQMFYFSATGAADRFFSARLVLHYCFGEDALSEGLRERYKAHVVELIMHGILAHRPPGRERRGDESDDLAQPELQHLAQGARQAAGDARADGQGHRVPQAPAGHR